MHACMHDITPVSTTVLGLVPGLIPGETGCGGRMGANTCPALLHWRRPSAATKGKMPPLYLTDGEAASSSRTERANSTGNSLNFSSK